MAQVADRRQTFVVIGASLAGGRAAEALRAEGFDGRVVLIGAEPEAPYERPPLSKEILRGSMRMDQLLLKPTEKWADAGIELLTGTRVTGLVPAERAVELMDGRRLTADKVLLCTGGRARELNVPGATLDGVRCLRTVADASAVRRHLHPGASVVVVGAGFIGAEVAASARELGCRVTLLELAGVPLGRVLGTVMGRVFARYHRAKGVDLRTGVGVERIEGDGRVRAVVLSDGHRIEADCVVVGVGIEPAVELAESAGLQVGDGVLVDPYCRTSLDSVFAAGDVANFPDPLLGTRGRLEHWRNAQSQAVAAARSMLGRPEPYAEVPWFWSDQYDLNLQVAGHPALGEEVVVRGDVEAADFCACYLRGDFLTGALAVNRPRELRAAMKLIENRVPVTRDVLADEAVDLRRVRKQAPTSS